MKTIKFKVTKINEKINPTNSNSALKTSNSQVIRNKTNESSPIENKSTMVTTNMKEENEKNKENLIEFIRSNNPKILEDFEVLDYIAKGSVGTFYEGRYRKGNKQKIGIKFFLNETKNPKRVKQKNEEISYLRRLKNKNIVGLFGHLKIDDFNTCAILELCKYGDLENFQNKILKRRYLPETLLCYFAKQILDSLNYTHRCGIIHSDIKQTNILIDSNLNIKLTDFSVSSSYSSIKEEKVKFPFVGTGKFIAPEILEQKKIFIKYANRIDLYSLGVVLYYLAYGTYPFNLKSIDSKDYKLVLETIKKEKEVKFLNDREISKPFKDFLKKLLEVDIDNRIDIKDALEHPWIKGAEIIFNEKEKVSCLEKFLIILITDSIKDFNDYIKSIESNY